MILENVSLFPYNTLKIDVRSKYFMDAKSEKDVEKDVSFIKKHDLEYFVLGGGSNVLFTENYDGFILRINIPGIELVQEGDENVWVEIGAGENWHEFVQYAIENDWAGIENLSLIPGTVGATPIQNIGAYGIEIKDVFDSLRAYRIDEEKFEEFKHKDCHFGYRDSIFKNSLKGKVIVTKVCLKLRKKPEFNIDYGTIRQTLFEKGLENNFTIRDVSNAVIEIRQSKLPDPKVTGNAGSFFKNPIIDITQYEKVKEKYPDIPSYPVSEGFVKVPAGWLIDQAGWKGKTLGNAAVHTKQALVLINKTGKASGSEIQSLSKAIKESVVRKYGIALEEEVNIL